MSKMSTEDDQRTWITLEEVADYLWLSRFDRRSALGC
jgi:hypothetical protein